MTSHKQTNKQINHALEEKFIVLCCYIIHEQHLGI